MDTDKNMKPQRHGDTEKHNKLIRAIFGVAKGKGIPAEDLRDVIAPSLINKRLSQATNRELGRVLDHITGGKIVGSKQYAVGRKQYESNIKGLKQEVVDLAAERFGENWEIPLNNLCKKFKVIKWQWLDVSHGKAVKETLLRLQGEGAYAVR